MWYEKAYNETKWEFLKSRYAIGGLRSKDGGLLKK